MSNKSARKLKSLAIPRTMDEIQREHAQLAMKAGSIQYQMAILGEELQTLNEQLRKVNNEGHARQQLDENKKTETTEVANGI